MAKVTNVKGMKNEESRLVSSIRNSHEARPDAHRVYAWMIENLHPETLAYVRFLIVNDITATIKMGMASGAVPPRRQPMFEGFDEEE